jgi:hypothetical protein
VRDEVEGDVETSGTCSQSVGVFVDRRLVESIDLRRLSDSSRGADLLGHVVEALQGSTGEMDLRALASEGTGYRAADRTAPAVDDSVLAL